MDILGMLPLLKGWKYDPEDIDDVETIKAGRHRIIRSLNGWGYLPQFSFFYCTFG